MPDMRVLAVRITFPALYLLFTFIYLCVSVEVGGQLSSSACSGSGPLADADKALVLLSGGSLGEDSGCHRCDGGW